jgi:heme/copper-type cytochrome/quinol oxidase subunit 4
MRTANYVFSVTSIILGLVLILFMFTQSGLGWNIGMAIGVVLIINGVVRLWFAQDDKG